MRFNFNKSIVTLRGKLTLKAHKMLLIFLFAESFQLDFNTYLFFIIKVYFKRDQMILLSLPLQCIWLLLVCIEWHLQDMSHTVR